MKKPPGKLFPDMTRRDGYHELKRWRVGTLARNSEKPAFHGQTRDEMYFGTGDAVPADLQSRAAAARRTRVEANRSASCEICPSAGGGRITMEC
jgi:hypothetical protein